MGFVLIPEPAGGGRTVRCPLAYIWISKLVTNNMMRLSLGQPASGAVSEVISPEVHGLCGENGNQSSDKRRRWVLGKQQCSVQNCVVF